MSKLTGPTNPLTSKLIEDLRQKGHKEKTPFLLEIADKLEVSRRQKNEVDLATLERVCKDGETVIVPGKVLSTGVIKKKITVAAANFSMEAVEKLAKSGSKTMTIGELIAKNPKGTDVRIVI